MYQFSRKWVILRNRIRDRGFPGVRRNDIQGNDIWGKVVQSFVIVAGKTVAKIVASQLAATNLAFHKPYQHKGKQPPLIVFTSILKLAMHFAGQ